MGNLSLFARMYRHYATLMILLNVIVKKFSLMGENFGHLFFHLTGDRKKPAGEVDFSVGDDDADGHVMIRFTDDYGQVRLEGHNFRCSNRWPLRNGRRPSGCYLMQIHTDALLRGWSIHSMVWGRLHSSTVPDGAYNVSRLLPEATIQKYNRRRVRLQRFLDRVVPGYTHRYPTLAEHTRADLIHRV